VEQENEAAEAELKAHTVMSASAATPTTATIGTLNRSKKLFCWAYGRARSRRPARTLDGRAVAGRWLGDGLAPAEAEAADVVEPEAEGADAAPGFGPDWLTARVTGWVPCWLAGRARRDRLLTAGSCLSCGRWVAGLPRVVVTGGDEGRVSVEGTVP
jgi:hypothetical protein